MGLQRLKNFVRFPRILRNVANSSKNASTEAASGAKPRSQEELSKMVGETMKKQWKSYGLYQHDKKLDYFEYHASVFVCAIFCVGICWFNYYRRDYSYRDWARREAMLLLLEREEQGLPYINRNYADPAKLELPTNEITYMGGPRMLSHSVANAFL